MAKLWHQYGISLGKASEESGYGLGRVWERPKNGSPSAAWRLGLRGCGEKCDRQISKIIYLQISFFLLPLQRCSKKVLQHYIIKAFLTLCFWPFET